jgi:APA family basic amino acid/polyamine antiporter
LVRNTDSRTPSSHPHNGTPPGITHLVANVAALRQGGAPRGRWRTLAVAGAAGCLLLTATLPWQSVVSGLVVIAAGLVYRLVVLRLRS